jgi:hypothetical protein
VRALLALQISLLLAFVIGLGRADAADPKFVYVKVMSGGKVCLVQRLEGSCDSVVERVTQARESLPGTGVTVSPHGCGEVAMAEAEAVAAKLKNAGFKGVFTIGFVSKPGSACAS